jgi:hypothetical protein
MGSLLLSKAAVRMEGLLLLTADILDGALPADCCTTCRRSSPGPPEIMHILNLLKLRMPNAEAVRGCLLTALAIIISRTCARPRMTSSNYCPLRHTFRSQRSRRVRQHQAHESPRWMPSWQCRRPRLMSCGECRTPSWRRMPCGQRGCGRRKSGGTRRIRWTAAPCDPYLHVTSLQCEPGRPRRTSQCAPPEMPRAARAPSEPQLLARRRAAGFADTPAARRIRETSSL